MKVNVYVDGFNLYYGALKDRPACKWLDMDAFAKQLLLPGQTVNRIRYFIARVSGVLTRRPPSDRTPTFERSTRSRTSRSMKARFEPTESPCHSRNRANAGRSS